MRNDRLVSSEVYWDTPELVDFYRDSSPVFRWYDQDLIAGATARVGRQFDTVRRLYAVGCGGGREIPALRAAFPEALLVVCDPAPSMIDVCRRNLTTWGYTHRVEVHCCTAAALPPVEPPAEVVLALDNVFTYVTPVEERLITLRALRALVATGGVLAGTVHQRWGRPTKATYFLLRAAARALGLVTGDPGDRVVHRGGQRTRGHYFTAGELVSLLAQTGFRPLVVETLAQVARRIGRPYPILTGDNNLTFLAVAV